MTSIVGYSIPFKQTPAAGIERPYVSPHYAGPDAVRAPRIADTVHTPSEALDFARLLVQQAREDVPRAATPAEATRRAQALLDQYLNGEISLPALSPRHAKKQPPPPQPPRAPQQPPRAGHGEPRPSPPPPQPLSPGYQATVSRNTPNRNWSPENARNLEAFVAKSVKRYHDVVAPAMGLPPPAGSSDGSNASPFYNTSHRQSPVSTSPRSPMTPLTPGRSPFTHSPRPSGDRQILQLSQPLHPTVSSGDVSLEDYIVGQLNIPVAASHYSPTHRGSVHPDDLEDCLKASAQSTLAAVRAGHNLIRSRYAWATRAAPLAVSDELTQEAARHAEKCAARGRMSYASRLPRDQGQCVQYLEGKTVSDRSDAQLVQAALDHWLAGGIAAYRELGRSAEAVRKAPHLAQVLWKATTHLGVGVARCGNQAFIVCNYWPRGNDVCVALPTLPDPGFLFTPANP
ncbi:hypothetical protein DIPPA_10422 [Diplonema papillatum]|nr:hypothetical protein DIPPA_10422 [Diplonema papillatum]